MRELVLYFLIIIRSFSKCFNSFLINKSVVHIEVF